MRQAGTWDLGPFAAVLAPGQTSPLVNKMLQRHWRTKNSCVHVQLGQIGSNRIQKDQKPNCPFWKIRSKSKVHCITPALNTTKRVGKLSYPSSPTPGQLLPSRHVRSQLDPTHRERACKGNCYLFSLPHTAAGAPIKFCLYLLSGLLSMPID